MALLTESKAPTSSLMAGSPNPTGEEPRSTLLHRALVVASVTLLFLNFFLAQFDKFVLSYFQTSVIRSLGLSSSDYGVLSGYATGIVYALLAIPIAYIADYTEARVWVLTVATLWWSVCVVFQGLSRNFWQILLARIGMGIGQAPVEALSISLISDLVGTRWLFVAESVLYIGVYVGEAVSAQIATAFNKSGTPWNSALIAMGIVGVVVGLLLRLILREPPRRQSILSIEGDDGSERSLSPQTSKLKQAKAQLSMSFSYIIRMRSLWLLTLSAGARQFSGVAFGYYMPSYLSSIYPTQTNLLSNYGIIVGIVGSFAVLAGGFICSYAAKRTVTMPLYITAIGGMISSVFVILMVLSRDIARGDQVVGSRLLYGVMSIAYLTAELWLGAFASLIALLLPPRTKTFGLAIYTSIIVLIYSSGPQILGLALRGYEVGSEAYIERTKVILAILIPVGYWIGGIGFLFAVRSVKRDVVGDIVPVGAVNRSRKMAFASFVMVLGGLVVALFVTSLVFR